MVELLCLIALADYCPGALLQVTCALLGRDDIGYLLQGHAEVFAQYLLDKITQIFQLETGLVAGPEEVPGVQSCPIIWELFEPVAPEWTGSLGLQIQTPAL